MRWIRPANFRKNEPNLAKCRRNFEPMRKRYSTSLHGMVKYYLLRQERLVPTKPSVNNNSKIMNTEGFGENMYTSCSPLWRKEPSPVSFFKPIVPFQNTEVRHLEPVALVARVPAILVDVELDNLPTSIYMMLRSFINFEKEKTNRFFSLSDLQNHHGYH